MSSLPFLLLSLAFFPVQLFAEEMPEAPSLSQNNFIQTVVMLSIGMAFFYFVLYRPEQQKRQILEKAKEKIKVGDRVVASGIIGVVNKIEKESLVLKMIDGNRIEVEKGTVSEVVAQGTHLAGSNHPASNGSSS